MKDVVVATAYGEVRGKTQNDVHSFKGILFGPEIPDGLLYELVGSWIFWGTMGGSVRRRGRLHAPGGEIPSCDNFVLPVKISCLVDA